MSHTWTSRLVELQRFGDDALSFDSKRDYLRLTGGEPASDFRTGMTHEEFLDRIERVRDFKQRGPQEAALQRLAEVVTRILALGPPAGRTQIDLVMSAKELAALPFEAVAGANGRPLLAEGTPPVELTRRLRGAFDGRSRRWPAKPEVLFAWSSAGGKVPHEPNGAALEAAVEPWGVERLVTLPNAGLEQISAACSAQPFTHVHLLAHGVQLGSDLRAHFGLALDDGEADAKMLAGALGAGADLPYVVSVAACDAGSQGSTVVSTPSIAHALHAAGVPAVIASQYPLTFDGSVILAKRLYPPLLDGHDIRDAIHGVRRALHAAGPDKTALDWLSLVAYVQLPEDYEDQLVTARLGAALAALETTSARAERLLRDGAPADAFDEVAARIEQRIVALKTESERAQQAMPAERGGLLASAYKRLAEVHFRRAQAHPGERGAFLEKSRGALQEAAVHYQSAVDADPSSHWTGVQRLSIEAVLHGKIAEPWRWEAAMHAARLALAAGSEPVWPLGSIAELHLLGPYAGRPPALDEAARTLEQLDECCPPESRFPTESTARQLRRYTDWWTKANGFFAGAASDLAAQAAEVVPERWRR